PPAAPPPAAPVYAQPPPASHGPPPDGAPPYGQPPPSARGYGAPPYGPPPAGTPYGYATGPVDGLGRPLAEWWQRAVAIIIDSIMLGVVFAILRAIFGGANTIVFNSNGTTTVHTGHLIVAEIIEFVLTLAYFGILDGGQKGQTLGKMALGIATRDINTGGPIGTPRAALRRFIYSLLFALLLIPGLINVLSPLWDQRRQAWHDKAVSSDVIKVR
ncbi:MAG: RDD family protein, partial [Acidimicrobiales bacterium]